MVKIPLRLNIFSLTTYDVLGGLFLSTSNGVLTVSDTAHSFVTSDELLAQTMISEGYYLTSKSNTTVRNDQYLNY